MSLEPNSTLSPPPPPVVSPPARTSIHPRSASSVSQNGFQAVTTDRAIRRTNEALIESKNRIALTSFQSNNNNNKPSAANNIDPRCSASPNLPAIGYASFSTPPAESNVLAFPGFSFDSSEASVMSVSEDVKTQKIQRHICQCT